MTVTAQSRTALLLAPLIFLLHVAEEAPGFVDWFNSLVTRDISVPLFLSVNAVGFLITFALAVTVVTTHGRTAVVVWLVWLGFAMFANPFVHGAATVVHARYSPGVVTGVLLFLPYSIYCFRMAVREFRVPVAAAVGAMILGVIPMAVHGYLLVFRGDRLF